MIAAQYGKLIKDRRMRKGLTQETLAAVAQVSRAVLSRLEQGKPQPVQTDTIERLLNALGVEPLVIDRPARDAARKLARLELQHRTVEQRNRHLRLAVELAGDEHRAPAKIARARERVALWRSKRTCSPFYIERWSRLLALPPRKLAKAMASLGEWEDALFQNSPWTATRRARASPRSRPARAARRSSGGAGRRGAGRG
jgi:transcriptional regulator with XRE-family HTH domain